MIVRPFDNKKDYQDVVLWWNKQQWPAIPEVLLSSSGFIIEKDNIDEGLHILQKVARQL